jgi:hypothetical protein
MRAALMLTEDSAWNVRLDREERERRAFATERVCNLVAMGLVEGAEFMAEQILGPTLDYDAMMAARARLFPGYVFIRNFLVGELDADPVIAARVAAQHTAAHNRRVGRSTDFRFPHSSTKDFNVGREVGWL